MIEMMSEIHITTASLARYYGVAARTVYGWRKGKCPDYVTRHLKHLVAYQAELDAVRMA